MSHTGTLSATSIDKYVQIFPKTSHVKVKYFTKLEEDEGSALDRKGGL